MLNCIQCRTANSAVRMLRFGSLAAAAADSDRVRFTPQSGHERSRTARPLWANSGHSGYFSIY
jgi:hypothetical protein